ncbi:MAG: hypothetical protein H7829_13995 [Magnetococcus sp. THC-1_WYH]
MSDHEQKESQPKSPATSGLNQRSPLVSDAVEETPNPRPRGIPQRAVKGQDGKKEFTIC